MQQHDYWAACGYRLMGRAGAHLTVSDAFLRSLLGREELAPVAQSCAAERALHARLLAEPRAAVAAAELAQLQDPDAAANYAVWLRFRSRLLSAPTLEASYAGLFRADVDVPPPLVAQLTQILLRHVLGDAAPPLQARAAEMLFRPQKVSILEDGSVMAADEQTVEGQALSGGFGSLGELLRRQAAALRSVDLDVLGEDNAQRYWERDERFDLAVSLNRGQPAPEALCRVLERWIAHFHEVEVAIEPVPAIEDERWVWHVGLDAQASRLLDDLYRGAEVAQERLERLLGLFRLRFADPADMRAEIAGRPVYLAMAMDPQRRLALKPQNLLRNLPLARRA